MSDSIADARRQDRAHRARRRDALVVHRLRDERDHRPRPAGRARRSQAQPAAHPGRHERPRSGARPSSTASAPRSPATPPVTTTRTARPSSTRRWCAWPRTSTCATRSSTARATSAPSTATRRRRCGTPRPAFSRIAMEMLARHRRQHRRLDAQLRRDAARAHRSAEPHAEPHGQRLAAASPSAWRPTSRRTTSARSCRRHRAPHRQPETPTADDLMQFIKGPDFPTGGIILGTAGIKEAYRTGRGRIRVRAKAHTEQLKGNRAAIVVTELPYQVNRSSLIEQHRRAGQEQEDQRDQRPAQRVRPQRHAAGHRAQARVRSPKVVLNKLYKHTQMQTTFGVINIALVGGVPRTLDPAGDAEGLHRLPERDRHSTHQVRARQGRDASPHPRRPAGRPRQPRPGHQHHPPGARRRHRPRGAHGYVRAHAPAGAGHPRPAPAEAHRPRARQGHEEHRGLLARIKELRELLGDENAIYAVIKNELLEIRRLYNDDRRTRDRAGRGRARRRRPHRRRADGDHHHQDRLRQAHAGRHLPPAEARRHRRRRHGPQGRGRGRAPLHHLHAPLPALLHQRRQGVPAQGPRAAAGRSQRQRQAPGQPAAAAPGREGHARSSTRATSTSTRASTSSSARARAS